MLRPIRNYFSPMGKTLFLSLGAMGDSSAWDAYGLFRRHKGSGICKGRLTRGEGLRVKGWGSDLLPFFGLRQPHEVDDASPVIL